MNLYFAWSKPPSQLLKANFFFWSDSFRPFGALFYRTLFSAAGFNPLPFRIVCLTIGIANIGLCFWIVRLIAASGRVAALAILLFAFQTRLMEVWYRTAVVYDLLSFTFFYLAACVYIGARRRNTYPGRARIAFILLCYVCALNSKEAAVALPIVLLAWELLFRRFAWKNLRLPVTLGLMNVPYIIGKTHGANALTNNPDYRPEYSFTRFAHSWSIFLNYIFIQQDGITPAIAIGVLTALLAIGLAVRSRGLIFAWVILFTTTLPIVFLTYRGAFVLYISWVGWTLYAALLIVKLQDLATRASPQYRTALACLVFLLVAWRWGKANLHDQRADPRHWLYDPPAMVHDMADQMRALHPMLPKGAAVLFLEDPFGTDEWTPYFIMKLLYRDDTLRVDRVKMMIPKPAARNAYQFVFAYSNGRYTSASPVR